MTNISSALGAVFLVRVHLEREHLILKSQCISSGGWNSPRLQPEAAKRAGKFTENSFDQCAVRSSGNALPRRSTLKASSAILGELHLTVGGSEHAPWLMLTLYPHACQPYASPVARAGEAPTL